MIEAWHGMLHLRRIATWSKSFGATKLLAGHRRRHTTLPTATAGDNELAILSGAEVWDQASTKATYTVLGARCSPDCKSDGSGPILNNSLKNLNLSCEPQSLLSPTIHWIPGAQMS